ncbi:MAG: hypothetical protein II703_00680 [Ruminococcus sp.]|nr:hypothetical protein [Ruminococcus sp.]
MRRAGDEKQHTHRFWIGFLQKVLGVDDADEHIRFEKPVKYKGHKAANKNHKFNAG